MSMIPMNADLILDSEINETTARLLNNIITYDNIGQSKLKAVCEELEQAHKEIEALKSQLNTIVAGLHSEKDIREIKANAIRKAAKHLGEFRGLTHSIMKDELYEYADNIEAGK